MNKLPRQMLRRIIAKHGKNVCDDARRCEGLLNDLCGAYRREINVLVNAIEERVPLDLLAGARTMAPELLLIRLEKRLEDQQGLTAEAARWSVESWALALDIVTDAEIEDRGRKLPETPKAELNELTEHQNRPANHEDLYSGKANSPPSSKPHAKATLPASPANHQPAIIPQGLPSGNLPSSNRGTTQSPSINSQRQPATQTTVFKSRFGILRGCLVVVFLLAIVSVALFLGVPYAIEVMRETQRERNSEPPRFPSR